MSEKKFDPEIEAILFRLAVISVLNFMILLFLMGWTLLLALRGV